MARPYPDRFAVCIGDHAGAEALIARAIERFDVADIDLYTIDTSALPTPIRVDAVKLGYRAKVDAGGAKLVPVLRSESTTEEQTDDALAMSTSYTVQCVNYDVDPIDDAAWDATKLAALEVGQRKGL